MKVSSLYSKNYQYCINKKYLKQEDYCVIGIDIGGTKISSLLVDVVNGLIFHRQKTIINENIKNDLLNFLSSLIAKLKNIASMNNKEVLAIGISIASTLDKDKSTLVFSPSYRALEGVNLKSYINKKFDCFTIIEHDLNAAAWGEKCIGSGKKFSNFIMITLGTGVGGAHIYNNRLVENLSGAFLLGHVNLMPENGKVCTCGNTGCVQTVISGTAIKNKVVEMIKDGIYPNCNGKDKSNIKDITAKDVFEAAKKGDSIAKGIIDETAYYCGIIVSDLIHIIGPQAIIIGGGVAQAGDILFDPIKKVARARALFDKEGACKILQSSLGEESSSIGISLIAIDKYFRNISFKRGCANQIKK